MNFRLLDIPVTIQPSFWIFLLFLTNIFFDPSLESLIIGVVALFSLLVHEYGHALTAAYFGARPAITLQAFGGNAQYDGYGITEKQNFLITLGGPLLESVLIVISYYLLKTDLIYNYYVYYFLRVTMQLNILWCLFNLIPIVPLDGGHLARYFLRKWFGSNGDRIGQILGVSSVILIAPYLFYQGLIIFAVLLVVLGVQNFETLNPLKKEQVSPFTTYMQGVRFLKENNRATAKNFFKKLLRSSDEQFKHLSIEALAKIHLEEKDPQQAYRLLLKANPDNLKEGKVLLCKLAFDHQNDEIITKYSVDIYNNEPTFEIAALNSKAYARLNKATLAGAWLFTASQFGPFYEQRIKELLNLPFYDTLRDQEAFKKYLEKIYPSIE